MRYGLGRKWLKIHEEQLFEASINARMLGHLITEVKTSPSLQHTYL